MGLALGFDFLVRGLIEIKLLTILKHIIVNILMDFWPLVAHVKPAQPPHRIDRPKEAAWSSCTEMKPFLIWFSLLAVANWTRTGNTAAGGTKVGVGSTANWNEIAKTIIPVHIKGEKRRAISPGVWSACVWSACSELVFPLEQLFTARWKAWKSLSRRMMDYYCWIRRGLGRGAVSCFTCCTRRGRAPLLCGLIVGISG